MVVVGKPQKGIERLQGQVVLQINAFSVCLQVYLHTEMQNTLKAERLRLCIYYIYIYLAYTFGIGNYVLLQPTSSTTEFFLLLLIAYPPTSTALSCVEARKMLCTSRCANGTKGRLHREAWNVCTGHVPCRGYCYMMLHTWGPDPWSVVQHLHWCTLPVLSKPPESPKSTESSIRPFEAPAHCRQISLCG